MVRCLARRANMSEEQKKDFFNKIGEALNGIKEIEMELSSISLPVHAEARAEYFEARTRLADARTCFLGVLSFDTEL